MKIVSRKIKFISHESLIFSPIIMFFSSTAKNILGMNARNLEYISKYNSKKHKRFADDKIFTKDFLSSRGIGVAKLYHHIKDYEHLTPKFFDNLPSSFVIKPNRGFGGGGITVITERKKNNWITPSDKKLSEADLFRRCTEILEGKYSISGSSDSIIFEERLEPHPDFNQLTDVGLPDVRVIAFNNVPIMAMTRIPNIESEGKANMELGAYGLGIDIGSGKTTGAAYFSQYTKRLPGGISAVGFQIPHWEEILHTVSKIQIITGIGYLGIDLVITKNKVAVLELNARAGLKIQVANRTPQKARLRKVADLKVLTPEDGVQIAKTLFSEKLSLTQVETNKTIIGAKENIILNTHPPQSLVAKIDLHAEENKINPKFVEPNTSLIDITLAGQRLKLPTKTGRTIGADITLAAKYLPDYIIDPSKKFVPTKVTLISSIEEEKILKVDNKLAEIDQTLKLLAFINPQNLAEQRDLFLRSKEHEPRFIYREPKVDFNLLERELRRLPDEVSHPLWQLWQEKKEYLFTKIKLLKSVGTPDFSDYSAQLFTPPTEAEYQAALKFVTEHQHDEPDHSRMIKSDETHQRVKKYLKDHGLDHWQVKRITETVADMQVIKSGSVLIKDNSSFTENRLQALLVHEIGTHVFRNENGRQQMYQIFAQGTANYLTTEEGLAVYNQRQLGLLLGEKNLYPALSIITIYRSQRNDFRYVFESLIQDFDLNTETAWNRCVKVKRGLNNNQTHGAFSKDVVYFRGHQQITEFLKKGGQIEDLYVGKISLEDLEIVQKFGSIKPAKYLVKK
jgi:alpha-L-glutamate ligase-like protein/uncharacterized protein (TIGR02421 family)